ncbi:hypothetical protein GCM10009853_092420 [Glycomyces scopariae]
MLALGPLAEQFQFEDGAVERDRAGQLGDVESDVSGLERHGASRIKQAISRLFREIEASHIDLTLATIATIRVAAVSVPRPGRARRSAAYLSACGASVRDQSCASRCLA